MTIPNSDIHTVPEAPRPARLFEGPLYTRSEQAPASYPDGFAANTAPGRSIARFEPRVSEELIEIFERVPDPTDDKALFHLFEARLETMRPIGRPELAEIWRSSPVLRRVSPEDVLRQSSTVGLVKEVFNYFFRDDLYGRLRDDSTLIMSSGAVCEESFGLSQVGKAAISYALDRDWYGYSDSNGRVNAREALAQLENVRLGRDVYSADNIAITMGATHGINSVADLVLIAAGTGGSPALAGIPNYPPLVKSIARGPGIQMVPLACENGVVSADPLIEALTPDTPLVLLQSVANPTGALIDEESLARLIEAASDRTTIVIDECHEFLGPDFKRSPVRAARNVVRVVSLSKFASVPGMKLGWVIGDDDFIRDYYEVASTKYGGPPSIFFTLLEVYGRLERFRVQGLDRPGASERGAFEKSYSLSEANLDRAYDTYRLDWEHRTTRLTEYRALFSEGLRQAGLDIIVPDYSINMIAFAGDGQESYPAFRDLIDRANVSTYPGILNFCFGSNGLRFSSARRWSELEGALMRIAG